MHFHVELGKNTSTIIEFMAPNLQFLLHWSHLYGGSVPADSNSGFNNHGVFSLVPFKSPVQGINDEE